MQMKRLIGHKWVIGAAALIMVFAIAGIAVAANTTTGGTGTAATAGPDASGNGVAPGGPMMGGRGGRRGGMGFGGGQQQNGVGQQMRDATQKLVRDKMSATDQAAFDTLVAQQKEEQTALQNAAKALRDTNQQIREMTAKTLGVTLPTTTTTQAPAGG